MLPLLFNMQVQLVLVLNSPQVWLNQVVLIGKWGEVESVHSLNKLHGMTANIMTKA
jgi:hypothetical protein